MAEFFTAKYIGGKDAERAKRSSLKRLHQAAPRTPLLGIGFLQRTMGNRSVRQVLQRSAHSFFKEQNEVPSIVQSVVDRGGGQPLDPATQHLMESRFGVDFSQVRVHTDSMAAESAQAVNAKVYTVNNDVIFGSGQYHPETVLGKSLLAHELTHVVQQANGLKSKLMISQPRDQYEQEADRVAQSIHLRRSLRISSQEVDTGLMRQMVEREAAAPKTNKPEEDSKVKELKDKVRSLVKTKFGGDYKKAFNHYDANHDGGVNASELTKLLEDADIGNAFTRKFWVSGIIDRLDTNKNGKIEWGEFEKVLQ